MEPLFIGNDLRLIEALEYDQNLKPIFDVMRDCLIWTDERAEGLTPAGHESLCDLWIARSFIHRNRDFSTHRLDPKYFENIWARAKAQGFRWPGFNRMSLTDAEREYLHKMLVEESTNSAGI